MAIRLIVSKLLSDDIEYDGVGDEWQNLWMRFIKGVLKIKDAPEEHNEKAKERWIDDVVAAFCRQYNVRNKIENLKI